MCFSKGHSLGKNVQAISRLLACQYSLSSSRSSFTSGFKYLPRECKRKRISVDIQKYETASIQSLSKNESLDSSVSSLGYCKKSACIESELIYMILPIFKFFIHSSWLRKPRTLLISGSESSSSSCDYAADSGLGSSFLSVSYPASLLQTSLTTGYNFRLDLSTKEIDCSKKFLGSSRVGVELKII